MEQTLMLREHGSCTTPQQRIQIDRSMPRTIAGVTVNRIDWGDNGGFYVVPINARVDTPHDRLTAGDLEILAREVAAAIPHRLLRDINGSDWHA